MPELPEVETIVRELKAAITGKTLSRFLVFDKKRIARPRLVLPQKVIAVSRHGKYIVCETRAGSETMRCLVHLRMTGELLFENKNHEPRTMNHKHERARFHFSDGSVLRFLDVRRFGTIEWRGRLKPLPILGIDPLSTIFTSGKLKDLLRNSSRPVKSLLLDQQKISGLGNIYADEALWHARTHPAKPSNTLKIKEITKLAGAIRRVLNEGIKKGGFTLRDYRRIDGSFGYYQKSRRVYGREGGKCFRCSARIRRIKANGRSSYFCPNCQR